MSTGIVPNDPRFDKQWDMEVIQADEAWNLTTGSTRITVAVIDIGIDYTHPDLYQNIWINQDEIPAAVRAQLQDVDGDGLITFWDLNEPVNQGPGKITDLNGTGFIDGGDLLQPVAAGGWENGRDDGNDGFVDDLIGWDFFDNDNDPMETPLANRKDIHGTPVAGIIGAVGNNGMGTAGINWRVQIMPVRFYRTADFDVIFSPGVFERIVAADISAARYAVNNGARVVNFTDYAPTSIVPPPLAADMSALLDEAVARGVLFVTTAGNDGDNTDIIRTLPGGLPHDNIINVAATRKDDKLINYSNFGLTTVDLGAPTEVWTIAPLSGPHITYHKFGGTSAAAPHVTGAAALILSTNPNLSYAQVKDLILNNVDVVPDLVRKTVTGGRLNIFNAVSATPRPLLVSSVGPGATETLTADQLAPLVTEALARWQATGVNTSNVGTIDIRIANLGGTMLGLAAGNTIWLDDNAAGWGWFVDKTPWEDSEFTRPGNQGEKGRIDLLSVLMHEVGHLLGHDHGEGLMAETLAAGSRLAPASDMGTSWYAADALFALLAADEQTPWIGSCLFGGKWRRQ